MFEQWCTSKGFDAAVLTDAQRSTLTAQYQHETAPAPAAAPAAAAPAAAPVQGQDIFTQRMNAIDAENERQDTIRQMATTAAEEHIGDRTKCKQIWELAQTAIENKSTTPKDFQLALHRVGRFAGSMIPSKSQQVMTDEVIEAALAMTHRIPGHEKAYSDQVLQTAKTTWKRGLGLREMLHVAAQRNNNYRGSTSDYVAMTHAAMRTPFGEGYNPNPRAEGISTISVSGILSNVANKQLEASFLGGEMAFQDVAKEVSMTDFKQKKLFRIASGGGFQKVAKGGELKHTTLSELEYDITLQTYGDLLGIDRTDIVNDDLGAFMNALDLFGVEANSRLNIVFWTEFLDDSAFFSSGNGNLTTDTSAAVLSLANLSPMEAKFRKQTKLDGSPLAIRPAILLTTADQANAAATMLSSTLLIGASGTISGDANVLKGRFQLVDSVYLGDTTLGGLTTLWYLIANPAQLALMYIGYLNGQRMPVTETSQFEFDRLGLSMRAYLDYAVAKGEYRAGQKANGEGS